MRAGLVRDQRHAQHALGFLLHILDGFDDLDAAALAAAAGMDLRLHHPDRTAQFLGRGHRFLDREGGLARGTGAPKAAQNLLGLIFMDIHGISLSEATDGGGGHEHNSSRLLPRKRFAGRSGFRQARERFGARLCGS